MSAGSQLFYPCVCGDWLSTEKSGPFAGKLIAHRDDVTNRQCVGSYMDPDGPGRTWNDLSWQTQ